MFEKGSEIIAWLFLGKIYMWDRGSRKKFARTECQGRSLRTLNRPVWQSFCSFYEVFLAKLNHTLGYDLNLTIVLGKRRQICEKKISVTTDFCSFLIVIAQNLLWEGSILIFSRVFWYFPNVRSFFSNKVAGFRKKERDSNTKTDSNTDVFRWIFWNF